MAGIGQEGRSLRSAPQSRHMANLRLCSHSAPGKLRGPAGEVIKIHGPPGTVCSPSTWSPELLGLGQGTKRFMQLGKSKLDMDPRCSDFYLVLLP